MGKFDMMYMEMAYCAAHDEAGLVMMSILKIEVEKLDD